MGCPDHFSLHLMENASCYFGVHFDSVLHSEWILHNIYKFCSVTFFIGDGSVIWMIYPDISVTGILTV